MAISPSGMLAIPPSAVEVEYLQVVVAARQGTAPLTRSAVSANPLALFTMAISPSGMLAIPPSAVEGEYLQGVVAARQGTAPLTSPLSSRQLNPNQGPRLNGWYCACVVCAKTSSWSMRNTPGAKGGAMPLTVGGKKRAATEDITMNA